MRTIGRLWCRRTSIHGATVKRSHLDGQEERRVALFTADELSIIAEYLLISQSHLLESADVFYRWKGELLPELLREHAGQCADYRERIRASLK